MLTAVTTADPHWAVAGSFPVANRLNKVSSSLSTALHLTTVLNVSVHHGGVVACANQR